MPSIVAGMRDKPKRVLEYRFLAFRSRGPGTLVLVVYGLGRAA